MTKEDVSTAELHWLRLMAELSIDETTWTPHWNELELLYAEPHRTYHNIRHIGHFLEVLHRLAPTPSKSQRVAAFFHDAIYDPKRKDNERLSADLALSFLIAVGFSDSLGPPVEHLIMATVSHNYAAAAKTLESLNGEPLSPQELAEFLDSDLAILGSLPEQYKQYCQAIELEYSHVPPAMFAVGRAQFLDRFVQSEQPLFHSETGQAIFESNARKNLKQELIQLRGEREKI